MPLTLRRPLHVGTNLEPNGTSLCMEELGRGFFVFCGFLVFFWMLFDPCLRNMLFCDEIGRLFVV